MTSLHQLVRIAGRFQRSVRIDTDLDAPQALEGFVCPSSSADVLKTMAHHIVESGHTAFTWTGPYGGGKSSLVIALAMAISSNDRLRKAATRALDESTAAALRKGFPAKPKGWRVVPVIGRRCALSQLIGEALEARGLISRSRTWTDASVLKEIDRLASDQPKLFGGLVLIIDELGKVLEGAAQDNNDVYLLQQIAERAARSNRRLVVVGILHQAFDEYAQRLSRESRDEWAKIQGRFVDIIINTTGNEQLELLSRAIEGKGTPKTPGEQANSVAAAMSPGRVPVARHTASLLNRCWPLHPVSAALLGPLSRRRFGQNQRSLFAFLNSAERLGFRQFLREAKAGDLYQPDRLWDYLQINLEPAILASPDGHRWAIGADAVERCIQAESPALDVSLLKAIILIDLLRERSGLNATIDVVRSCANLGTSSKDIERALKRLSERSCIVFRRHLNAYAVFAGSDFDLDEAISTASNAKIDLRQLRTTAGIQPLIAKRHYHATGAIRWFNFEFVPLSQLSHAIAEPFQASGATGRFLLAIPTTGESRDNAEKLCAVAVESASRNAIVGLSASAWRIIDLARELNALTTIHDERTELRGDAVARREVVARLQSTQGKLEAELRRITETTTWYQRDAAPALLTMSGLNGLASRISDELYPYSPKVCNELLNREYPSSNAVKAQKDLLKRMLTNAGEHRLGLTGWPAEAGLMESILVATKLYQLTQEGWQFVEPSPDVDHAGLYHLWRAGLNFLQSHKQRPVKLSELYEIWGASPFGIKNGLMPIFVVALYVTHRERLAMYRQSVFQPEMTDVDVDLLTSDPNEIQLRWMELSESAREILIGLGNFTDALGDLASRTERTPLGVGRALVGAFDRLPSWTKRSSRLSATARQLANTLRYAADPNRLLFDDLPKLSDKTSSPGQIASADAVQIIEKAFQELQDAYPSMLEQLERLMIEELEVPSSDGQFINLRQRALNLKQLSGDMRLNAFINRLSSYTGALADIESIASLSIDKRPADWVDTDFDQARLRIAELAQQFKRHEEIARVAGRPDTRHRMAVIVPSDGTPRALHKEFVVNATDSEDIEALIEKIDAALSRSDKPHQNIILAALAQLSARYMYSDATTSARPRRRAG